MYFSLSWKTWKTLFTELVSFFYCIYFPLLLVIWLSVEKMFSAEPIAAFLDLCSCYIFWLHLWVNKNVDGCLKYVYNIDISINILLNRIIFWGICKYRIAVYENRYRIESWRTIRFTPLVISDSTAVLRSYENSFCVQKTKIMTYSTVRILHITLAPFWRVSRGMLWSERNPRKRVMLLTQNVHVRRVYIQIIA